MDRLTPFPSPASPRPTKKEGKTKQSKENTWKEVIERKEEEHKENKKQKSYSISLSPFLLLISLTPKSGRKRKKDMKGERESYKQKGKE